MSVNAERAVQEAVALAEPETSVQAQTCAPARENTSAIALAATSVASGEPVTDSDQEAGRNLAISFWLASQKHVRDATGAVAGVLSGQSVWSTAPASLADKHHHHRQAAGHFEARALRYPRLAWGYLHLLIKMLLHAIEWVLESPPRVLVAAVIALVIWIFT